MANTTPNSGPSNSNSLNAGGVPQEVLPPPMYLYPGHQSGPTDDSLTHILIGELYKQRETINALLARLQTSQIPPPHAATRSNQADTTHETRPHVTERLGQDNMYVSPLERLHDPRPDADQYNRIQGPRGNTFDRLGPVTYQRPAQDRLAEDDYAFGSDQDAPILQIPSLSGWGTSAPTIPREPVQRRLQFDAPPVAQLHAPNHLPERGQASKDLQEPPPAVEEYVPQYVTPRLKSQIAEKYAPEQTTPRHLHPTKYTPRKRAGHRPEERDDMNTGGRAEGTPSKRGRGGRENTRPETRPSRAWRPLNASLDEVLLYASHNVTDFIFGQIDPSRTGGNQALWCNYHVGRGHTTNQCQALRRKVEELIQRGDLRHFVADKSEPSPTTSSPRQ